MYISLELEFCSTDLYEEENHDRTKGGGGESLFAENVYRFPHQYLINSRYMQVRW